MMDRLLSSIYNKSTRRFRSVVLVSQLLPVLPNALFYLHLQLLPLDIQLLLHGTFLLFSQKFYHPLYLQYT